jgi:hypothetical protein
VPTRGAAGIGGLWPDDARRSPTLRGALVFHEALFDGNGAAGLGGATGLAVSPDGKHAYVTGSTDDAVAVVAIQAP